MILQGLSAETLARLVSLARYGEDFSGLLSGPTSQPAGGDISRNDDEPPERLLAAE